MYLMQAYLDHQWKRSVFSWLAVRRYLYVASLILHRLNPVCNKRFALLIIFYVGEMHDSFYYHTCVWFAVVRAENVMKSQIYFFGILRNNFVDIVRVFPLPVGPTHNIFVSLTRRYPINVALRTLSMVGTSISTKILIYQRLKIYQNLCGHVCFLICQENWCDLPAYFISDVILIDGILSNHLYHFGGIGSWLSIGSVNPPSCNL